MHSLIDTTNGNETSIVNTEMSVVTSSEKERRRLVSEEGDDSRKKPKPKERRSHSTSDPNTPKMDINLYATKKNIAQGMLDLSLLSANCSQLKYLLNFTTNEPHSYFFIVNLSCIAISIGLQIIVGILLILNVRHNILIQRYQSRADSYSNAILIGVFIITVINVFLSVFISA